MNGLNTSIKKQRLKVCMEKQNSTVCDLQETHFKYKYTHQIKVREEVKICCTNTDQKKA